MTDLVNLKGQLANERAVGSAGQYGVGTPECNGMVITATGSVSFASAAAVTIYAVHNAGADAVGSLILDGIKNESAVAKSITIPAAKLTAGSSVVLHGLMFTSGLTLTINASDADKFLILYRLTGV